MKLNLKKLCPLLILCITAFATMPKVFAVKDEPEKQPSVRKRGEVTSDQNESIKEAVREFINSNINWKKVGKKLGRSPIACKARWDYLCSHILNETATPAVRRDHLMTRMRFDRNTDEMLMGFVEQSNEDATQMSIDSDDRNRDECISSGAGWTDNEDI